MKRWQSRCLAVADGQVHPPHVSVAVWAPVLVSQAELGSQKYDGRLSFSKRLAFEVALRHIAG